MRQFLLSLALVGFVVFSHAQEKVEFGQVDIQIGDKNLTLELAVSWQQRQRGLMFRKSLCKDCGMLFVFEDERIGSIWMKNTFVPLDLAYIDNNGVITDIKALQPQDLTSVHSSQKILYALEMNQGWFAKNDVKVGDRVSGLPD